MLVRINTLLLNKGIIYILLHQKSIRKNNKGNCFFKSNTKEQ